MAASKEIVESHCTYDIFLSFRGPDTRKTFTSHLYSNFMRAGFHTFRDDDELDVGEKIDAGLDRAIEESKISVVVFSKDYASSRWCLKELVRILEKVKDGDHTLISIFYDVTPSQVGKQTGSFASSFSKHEEQLKDMELKDMEFNEETDKINQWRAALKYATDLKGMELNDMHESDFIEDVVKEIRNKLHPGKLDLTSILVGTDRIVEKINSWLQDEAHEESMAMIYGLGGVGKTTIAKILYNKNLNKFDSCSFIANIKDVSKDQEGLIRLQKHLLSGILKGKIPKVYLPDDGIVNIQKAIYRKKVLIILDDVDESQQLEKLLGEQKLQLFPGSKIILTTRYEGLLIANYVFKKFQIEALAEEDSLHLFSWHAFRQNHPFDNYLECSTKFAKLCGGLPLALRVLGSSLFGIRSIDVWEDTLEILKTIPDDKIQEKLKISYDSLKDRDRNLFLHIACFFVGMEKNYVTAILKGCDFHTSVGIQNLIDRCLLSVQEDNKLCMHQLLIEMGKEIVRQESADDPGERTRLWNFQDAFSVLEDKTGSGKIKGLVLDVFKLVENSYPFTEQPMDITSSNPFPSSRRIHLHTESFRKMQKKLQILQLDGVNLKGDFNCFPKNLVMLCWHEFPLCSIPTNFHLEKLVSLDLSYSDIIIVWDGIMVLPKLKFFNLSHCKCLTKMPNFAKTPCVERLIFIGCINLIEVDESIECLKKLLILHLMGCSSLKRIPNNINMLESLEEIDMSGCSNLVEFPEDMTKMKSLKIFNANGSGIHQVLSNTTSSTSGRRFSLASLPSCLVKLSLIECNLSDDAFLSDLSNLGSLRKLDLSGNPFHGLPKSTSNLNELTSLKLNQCTRIQTLQNLPANLKYLKANNCSSLERIQRTQVMISRFPRMVYLYADQCDKLVEVQSMLKIYSIEHINKAILNSLGLSDIESLRDIKVVMFNDLTHTKKTTSLQVFYESGAHHIFLPGDNVPNCFSLQFAGREFSFDVPSAADNKIYALNLCISYRKNCRGLPWSGESIFYLRIRNETKNLAWSYTPTCYAVPRDDEENILWISHWKTGDQLKVGDQVRIYVKCVDVNIKCGISFDYEAKDIICEQIPFDSRGKNGAFFSPTSGLIELYENSYSPESSSLKLYGDSFSTTTGIFDHTGRPRPNDYPLKGFYDIEFDS